MQRTRGLGCHDSASAHISLKLSHSWHVAQIEARYCIIRNNSCGTGMLWHRPALAKTVEPRVPQLKWMPHPWRIRIYPEKLARRGLEFLWQLLPWSPHLAEVWARVDPNLLGPRLCWHQEPLHVHWSVRG